VNQDAPELPQLTERQEQILASIVREYVAHPEPVSSKVLAERSLNVSSATIRNDMAVLEELGYIGSPHTSAGRIPTDAGYRYFVKRLLTEVELPAAERHDIAERFQASPPDVQNWLRLAVSTLARVSKSAALVTVPRAMSRTQFKHVELIATQGRLVLLVLVLYGGHVQQQMLTLSEVLPQAALSATANRLNVACDLLEGEQIRTKAKGFDTPLDREIGHLIAETMQASDTGQHSIAYQEGLSDALPEFIDQESAQQAIRLLEHSSLLDLIINEAYGTQIDGVRVVIGGEGRIAEVGHLSLILGQFGAGDQTMGLLGVLGPLRMRYEQSIGLVRLVSGVMSGLLLDAYSNEPKPPSPDLPEPSPP